MSAKNYLGQQDSQGLRQVQPVCGIGVYIKPPDARLARRYADTIQLLQDHLPRTIIVTIGILPRGDGSVAGSNIVWPGIYTQGIMQVNAWLKEQAILLENLHYLDCGPELLKHGKVKAFASLSFALVKPDISSPPPPPPIPFWLMIVHLQTTDLHLRG